MAKKRGQYKKDKLYTGGYKIIRKGKLSNKEYIEEMIKVNYQALQDYYIKRWIEATRINQEAAFLKQFPTVESLIRNQFRKGTQKEWKELIDVQFAYASARVAQSLMTVLIKYNQLDTMQLLANKKITLQELEKVRYQGNNIYFYTTENGRTIVIDIHNSPQDVLVYER